MSVPLPPPAAAAPSTGSSIPWHRRLEARVVVGLSLVAGISLAAVLVATARVVRTNLIARAADDLEAARVAFYQLVEGRAKVTATELRLIAEMPVFRAHMSDIRLAADAATLHEMADGYRRALAAGFLVVTDEAGTWIASPEWPAGTPPPSELARGIEASRLGRGHRAVAAVEDRLYIVVTEPARFANEVLGTITVAYQLDDSFARDLAQTTRCDVSLIRGRRVSGSSLALQQRENLAARLATDEAALGQVGHPADLRPVGDKQYVSGTYPLEADSGSTAPGTLVLLQDWAPTQQFVDEIQTRVAGLGAVTFLLALGGGLVLSRRVTRPLREIATVAQEIAAGRWDRRVPTRGHDEAAVMAAAFNDMTETLTHWHAEAHLREQELRQAQKMEAVGQLAGGVAHDFNNLLTAIHGYSELVLLDLATDDRRRANVQQILKAAESAGTLTRQLLAFSRKQILAPKVVSLGEIVRGMENLLQRLIGADITLIVRQPQDLWFVKADPGQLEQVIMNLAVNARDAMPDGGRLSIAFENVDSPQNTRPGRYVSMTVRDTGCGMDAATLTHIFEPFFTTKEPGRGTGLGLAMVYGSITQTGWRALSSSSTRRYRSMCR